MGGGEHSSGMKGDDFYNKHSSWQQLALEPAEEYLLKVVHDLPIPTSPSFNIADLGCSQGANSQRPVSLIIKGIREQSASRNHPISVFHVDLPSNDFNSLYKVLQSDRSYLLGQKDVFAFTEGKSFHAPLFPKKSFHLITSFCAIHWLSKKPANTSVTFSSTSETVAEADRLAFSAQAFQDLDNFLKLRADELVQGGKLVISFVSSNEEMKVKSEVIEYGTSALQSLLESGKVTLKEAQNCISCIHYRSPKETLANFEAVSDILQLDAIKYVDIAHPKYKLFLNGEIGAEEYALACTNFMRAIFEPSLIDSLDSSRPAEEKEKIVNELFDQIHQKCIKKPVDCHFSNTYFIATRK